MRDGRCSGGKNTRRIGAGHQRTVLNGLARNQTIYIDQQDQAAVRSDGGSGKHLQITQEFAQALDNDFIFADYIFNDNSHLPSRHVRNHHAEVAIDRLDWL